MAGLTNDGNSCAGESCDLRHDSERFPVHSGLHMLSTCSPATLHLRRTDRYARNAQETVRSSPPAPRLTGGAHSAAVLGDGMSKVGGKRGSVRKRQRAASAAHVHSASDARLPCMPRRGLCAEGWCSDLGVGLSRPIGGRVG